MVRHPDDRHALIRLFRDAAKRGLLRDESAAAAHSRVGGASVLEAQHLVKAYKSRQVVNDVSIQLGVLMVGVVIGWILGARAARDAYAIELKRRDERAARARMKLEKVEEVDKVDKVEEVEKRRL